MGAQILHYGSWNDAINKRKKYKKKVKTYFSIMNSRELFLYPEYLVGDYKNWKITYKLFQ